MGGDETLEPWDDDSDVVTGQRAQRIYRRHHTGGLSDQERGYADAYEAGRADHDLPSNASGEHRPAKGAGGTLGGLLVGAVVAANVLAYLEYGRAGVVSWWSAKFTNKPTLSSSSSTTSSSSSSTTSSASYLSALGKTGTGGFLAGLLP